jgi:hypothetical protein
MELPDLTRPYPGRLKKTDGRIDKVEVGYDIMNYRIRIANTIFVGNFLIST